MSNITDVSDQSPQSQRSQHPLANYQFSSDELRVLRECNTESFFQRSLPLGTTFGMAAYFAVKNGYLKGSVRFGPAPKVVVSVILGYFMGKFSYQKKCSEKIMQLPNSRLAEVLRAKKQGKFYETLTPDHGFGAGLSMAPFSAPPSTDQYSDEFYRGLKKSNALDLDTDRPSSLELDDSKRGDVDSQVKYEDDLPLQPAQTQTSYDELRRKNRDDFQKKNVGIYGQSLPTQEEMPPVHRAPNRSTDSEPRKATGPKNKYGDAWEQ